MAPDWNDVRIFLMVARIGTISGAGERLGIEHSTVSRRLDKLESVLGVTLFHRRRTGYVPTEQGRALIGHAERMEDILHQAIEGTPAAARIGGVVRIGAPEALGVCVLTPALARLKQDHPALVVHLIAPPVPPGGAMPEVDILLTTDPPDASLYDAERIAEVEYYLYASNDYIAQHPDRKGPPDIAAMGLIDDPPDATASARTRALDAAHPNLRRVFAANGVLAQRAAAAAGLGVALLPPYAAGHDDDLVRLSPGPALMTRALWMAAPEHLTHLHRIRTVRDFIRNQMQQNPQLFRQID